jgi:hypothetical protein
MGTRGDEVKCGFLFRTVLLTYFEDSIQLIDVIDGYLCEADNGHLILFGILPNL